MTVYMMISGDKTSYAQKLPSLQHPPSPQTRCALASQPHLVLIPHSFPAFVFSQSRSRDTRELNPSR